jgi:hypothetical protein
MGENLMNLNLALTLELDPRSIEKMKKAIIKECVNEIYKTLNLKKNSVLEFCKINIKKYLEQSPEIQSMISDNGKLRVELGINNSGGKIDRLIDYIAGSVDVMFEKFDGRALDHTISITVNSSRMKDIYSESFASYETEKGVNIEWLKWLLEAGDKDVIFGYRIRYGVSVGRTGEAVMIKSRQANWRVPPEFSGTIENNFITRSISSLDRDLANYIETIIS